MSQKIVAQMRAAAHREAQMHQCIKIIIVSMSFALPVNSAQFLVADGAGTGIGVLVEADVGTIIRQIFSKGRM